MVRHCVFDIFNFSGNITPIIARFSSYDDFLYENMQSKVYLLNAEKEWNYCIKNNPQIISYDEVIYPKKHSHITKKILCQGALLSEYPSQTIPSKLTLMELKDYIEQMPGKLFKLKHYN